MSLRLLFKYATRSRRSEFLRGIDSIVKNLADKDNYHILITIDGDDSKMHPLPVLNCNHTFIIGQSESKIHAINRDIDKFNYDWDILICMSDDMVFNKYGFDNVIREAFYYKSPLFSAVRDENTYVINKDTFLHFPDGNRSDLCTMSIIGKDYYNRDNYIYNPEYKSLYCDNEAQEVAKQRGCYKFVDTQIFEHLHPAYGKAVFDEQYQRTETIGNTFDKETYLRRKEMNFGL